jgi:ankyrin
MEYLFDLDRPYFASWLRLYDIDTNRSNSVFSQFTPIYKSDATPLYYAALCGFQDLVEHLTVKHPQHVNASGGFYKTPAVAALAGKHFELARQLRRRGSSVDPRGWDLLSPLHSAAEFGDLEVVQILVELKADINAPSQAGQTPLHVASYVDEANGAKVVRFLLEHGADATARSKSGFTPLHRASEYGRHKIVRVLLEHGVDIEATNNQGRTPLQLASARQHEETVKLLLEYGAK